MNTERERGAFTGYQILINGLRHEISSRHNPDATLPNLHTLSLQFTKTRDAEAYVWYRRWQPLLQQDQSKKSKSVYKPQTKRYEYQTSDHSCKEPDICGNYSTWLPSRQCSSAFVTDSYWSSSRSVRSNIANRMNYTKTANFKIHLHDYRGMSNDNI